MLWYPSKENSRLVTKFLSEETNVLV